MKTRLRSLLMLGGTLATCLFALGQANAQAVVQAYQTDTTLQVGMIVQLDKNNSSSVQPATQSASDHIHGVVVTANAAPFALSGSAKTQQVYVATTGNYNVLVSDQGGPIKKDDYIAISSLDGVGMKADSTQTYVIGKALGDFDGSANITGQTSVKDTGGNARTVHFGTVQVAVDIAHNPLFQTPESNVPDFLQKLTNSVANKPVSAIRIYVGVVILLIVAVISFSLLYAGVRTSILSLGRNPLAKKSILRNLFEVVLISLIVLISGLFGVYLLLKL